LVKERPMEHLVFELERTAGPAPRRSAVVVGVVASGNLEVMVETGPSPDRCRAEIRTTATGFGAIWSAVLDDFAARYPVAGLSLSINDGGATPAVVALRLGQAIEEYAGRTP
jgi:malonate decarboxylase delta subunit